MAKLPKYFEMKKMIHNKSTNKIDCTIVMKKWGIPILVFRVLRDIYELNWFEWLYIYPYMCIKMMFGGGFNGFNK